MELIKKYSTLNEVLLYLTKKTGYEYKLEDLYQLEVEGKLDVLFYFEKVRIRKEIKDKINNETKYEFDYISITAIFKKAFGGTVLWDGDPFGDEIIVQTMHFLKVHELLKDWFYDKSPFNPLNFDEDYIYRHPINFDEQDEIKKSLRFDSKQIIELLNINNNDTLTTENAQLKTEITQLKEQLAQAQPVTPADGDSNSYPWQNLNKHQYPPELHLATMIWEKIYINKEINNPHIDNHSDRFAIIAEQLGLNKQDHSKAMVDRLQTITTPQANKTTNDVNKLNSIKALYLKGLSEDDPTP